MVFELVVILLMVVFLVVMILLLLVVTGDGSISIITDMITFVFDHQRKCFLALFT